MKREEDKRAGARAAWHLVASEYPPQTGGVGDYTRLVAEGLAAAGEETHVWCPSLKAEEIRAECGFDEGHAVFNPQSAIRNPQSRLPHATAGGSDSPNVRGVSVHRELGSFSPSDLLRAGRLLDRHARPRRLLVQYVPHGYGYRAMNVPFCLWLWERARVAGDQIELMVHEPFCAFGEGTLKQDAAAAVHRLMTTILLRAARRVWTSIPAWEKLWRPYAFGRRVEFAWLPVPSTIAVAGDAARVADLRALYAPREDALLVGHFGTYARHVAVQLKELLPALLARNPSATALLVGRGGGPVREELARLHPPLAARLRATGVLPPRELSAHLAACDLLVQPFPDGVSSRRTSVMAALAHGLPVVTSEGRLTETLWRESGAVRLVAAGDAEGFIGEAGRLLADAPARGRLGASARRLYRERFDVSRVVARLRGAASETPLAEADVVLAG